MKLLFKAFFFICKYNKIFFKKIIFNINKLKQSKNILKNYFKAKKIQNFLKT